MMVFICLLLLAWFISTLTCTLSLSKINPEDKAEFDYIKYQLKHGVRLRIILYNLGYKKEQKVFEKLEEE